MRLATFDDDRVGVVTETGVVDVSDLIDRPFDGPIAAAPGASRMRRLAAAPALLARIRHELPARRPRPLAEVTLQAPLPDPGKIVAAPVNYQDHKAEMRLKGDINAMGFFLKAPTSVLGPGGQVRLPYTNRRIDHEAEFAVVIGAPARHVGPDEALGHVFGYTGLIDVTMRGGEERSMRKSFDTFTPVGPWIVTPDELGDPSDVGFTLWTNGTVRQKSNTAELIWDVARFVAFASTVTTLLPGDVISTGTPAGVSPLADGDTVTLEIDRIGRLTVTVTADGAVPCPLTPGDA
ncbi:fumarylacetoacetate hydrolase family protein [Micromonospora sp. NPDC005806]|uniref:fumarylacetoacetate hydrolase family protein n=1 Tax=Micromonospora sp. NPDC005806 TaxID=3364234 RepID=UPI00367BEE32